MEDFLLQAHQEEDIRHVGQDHFNPSHDSIGIHTGWGITGPQGRPKILTGEAECKTRQQEVTAVSKGGRNNMEITSQGPNMEATLQDKVMRTTRHLEHETTILNQRSHLGNGTTKDQSKTKVNLLSKR